MKALLAVFISFCLVLAVLFLTLFQSPRPRATYVAPQFDDRAVWSAVQEWRKSEGLQEYEKSDSLCKSADVRLQEIKTDYSHNGFDGLADKLLKNEYQSVGENLSQDITHAQMLLKAWLRSPSHRENLENNFTDSCIRCEGTYCVQLFAR